MTGWRRWPGSGSPRDDYDDVDRSSFPDSVFNKTPFNIPVFEGTSPRSVHDENRSSFRGDDCTIQLRLKIRNSWKHNDETCSLPRNNVLRGDPGCLNRRRSAGSKGRSGIEGVKRRARQLSLSAIRRSTHVAVWSEPSSTVTTSSRFRPISGESEYPERRDRVFPPVFGRARPLSVLVPLTRAAWPTTYGPWLLLRTACAYRSRTATYYPTLAAPHRRKNHGAWPAPWTPAISPSKPAGPRGRTRDRAVRGVSSWYPQRTASCFPRVKARAASHRACASSSVRHDTTSLPFLSLFLTLPTPPPPTPLALSPSCHDFCSAPGRDEARGERGWLAGSRSLNKRLDDVREWTTPRDHRKSIDDRGRGERNDTRVDLVRNRSSKDFCA